MGGAQDREDEQVDDCANILNSKVPAKSLKLLRGSKRKGNGTHAQGPSEARTQQRQWLPFVLNLGLFRSSIILSLPS